MSTDRKDKLEKALGVSESPYNCPWQDGAEWENARLAPLHAALLDAVEALEFYKKEDNWSPVYSDDFGNGSMLSDRDCRWDEINACYVGDQIAEEALSKIDDVLKSVERSET